MSSSSSASIAFEATNGASETTAADGWRRRAFFIALLGYVYIVAVGCGAAAMLPLAVKVAGIYAPDAAWPLRCVAHVGAIALAYASVWIVWSTVRGFFLSRHHLDGLELASDQAVPLRTLIARLANELRVPAPRSISITYDGSSWLSIRTHESGRRATTIYIGIAALLALPREEFAATLAHELAHLRARDARLSCFIERALERWCAYAVRFTQRRKFGAFPFAIVSAWFIARLSEPVHRLNRSSELDADTAAAACTEPGALAAALERLAIESLRAEESLWPQLQREALSGNPVPDDYSDRWRRHFTDEVDDRCWLGWQRSALYQEAAATDSHPTLSQRIAALGAKPGAFDRRTTGSTVLLGADWPVVRSAVDAAWKSDNEEQWNIGIERGEELRSRLHTDAVDRSPASLLAHALALEELGDHDLALRELRSLVEREPEMDEARFHLGSLLLADGDEEGVRHIDAVMEANEPLRLTAVCSAMDYMVRSGRFDEADRYRCVVDTADDLLDRAQRERAQLSDDDVFIPHGLESIYVRKACELLASIPQVRKAYLVRKQLGVELGDRIYVLAVDAPERFWRASLDDVDLRDCIGSRLIVPGELEIAVISGWESWLRGRIGDVPGSLVYARA